MSLGVFLIPVLKSDGEFFRYRRKKWHSYHIIMGQAMYMSRLRVEKVTRYNETVKNATASLRSILLPLHSEQHAMIN